VLRRHERPPLGSRSLAQAHPRRDRGLAAPAPHDYVDLYQLHHPDPSTPIDETLRALDDVVRAGKARYVGCSNYFAYQVARALGRSELLGLARLDSVQPRYNLLFRQVERELFPLCAEEGLEG
jgi:1-deoxyxylulose-5-phosphate synthase